MTVRTYIDNRDQDEEPQYGYLIECDSGIAAGCKFQSAAIFSSREDAKLSGQTAEDAMFWEGGLEVVHANGRAFELRHLRAELDRMMRRIWAIACGARPSKGGSEQKPAPQPVRRVLAAALTEMEGVLDPGRRRITSEPHGALRQRRKDLGKRDAAIFDAVMAGATFQQAAKPYGLKKHAAWQIVKRRAEAMGVDYSTVGLERLREMVQEHGH